MASLPAKSKGRVGKVVNQDTTVGKGAVYLRKDGAEGRTRTGTGCPTRPSNVRVYQFRHFGAAENSTSSPDGLPVRGRSRRRERGSRRRRSLGRRRLRTGCGLAGPA